MTKRASKSKAKASRQFLSARTVVAAKSRVDSVVLTCLTEFFAKHPPRHPEPTEIDVRKDWSAAWQPLLYRIGSSGMLAEYLETSPMSVSRWLNGKGMTDLTKLKVQALAQSLGLPSPI